jgi:hypothetical protein
MKILKLLVNAAGSMHNIVSVATYWFLAILLFNIQRSSWIIPWDLSWAAATWVRTQDKIQVHHYEENQPKQDVDLKVGV